MSYRGMGGFGGRAGDFRSFRRLRRAFRAGDVFDAGATDSIDPSVATDESAGLDLSGGTPDFSDVTGGSSSVPDLSNPFAAGLPALPSGIGTAIQQFMGGGGSVGSVAAAGAAAASMGQSVSRSGIVKAIRKHLGRAISGGKMHRRMNPGNFHALRRSMRRLTAFEHAARRVYHFTHPTRGKSHFKFRRKRRR